MHERFLHTCTGSSWQVEGRERVGCVPWCFSSLQPLPGATERCLPCPALVNTSCPPALPALPPFLPPSYQSAFPLLLYSVFLYLSFFLFFLLPFAVSPVPPDARALFISYCRSLFLSSPVGLSVISLFYSFPQCPALSFPFII